MKNDVEIYDVVYKRLSIDGRTDKHIDECMLRLDTFSSANIEQMMIQVLVLVFPLANSKSG